MKSNTESVRSSIARRLVLEQLGLLKRQGEGRSTRYYPAIEGWAE